MRIGLLLFVSVLLLSVSVNAATYQLVKATSRCNDNPSQVTGDGLHSVDNTVRFDGKNLTMRLYPVHGVPGQFAKITEQMVIPVNDDEAGTKITRVNSDGSVTTWIADIDLQVKGERLIFNPFSARIKVVRGGGLPDENYQCRTVAVYKRIP